MTESNVTQLMVVSQAAPKPNQFTKKVALYNADGTVLSMIEQTTAVVVITGYAIAGTAATLAATDTLNVALGKLEKNTAVKTSAILPITGYAIAGAAAALGATDTLNVALGKLEKNTAVKQAAAQADFAGADLAALKVELNAFLAKLVTATLVAP